MRSSMYLINLILTFMGFLTTITSSPTPTGLEIPVHPRLRPDVQSLLSFAALPATSKPVQEIHDIKNCGSYTIRGGFVFDLNANPNCASVEEFERMHRIINDKCGLCVTFEWENCVGRITWSGKTSEVADIPDSRSWYCIA